MEGLEALVAQVPDKVLDYIETLEERVSKAEAALPAEPETDPIEKALSELPSEVAEMVKSQRDRLEKAEKALEEGRIAKADAEWTNKVRSFDGLVDKPEDVGAQLREVAEINSDLADAIVKVLETASARFSKADLYKELGAGVAPAVGSAEDKIQAIAKSLVDADPKLTAAQAEAEAWERNPDLYEQHVAERRASLKEV